MLNAAAPSSEINAVAVSRIRSRLSGVRFVARADPEAAVTERDASR